MSFQGERDTNDEPASPSGMESFDCTNPSYQLFIYFYYMLKTLGTHNYFVYILTNKNKTVLYTGVTNNLKERLHFHRNPTALSKAFTTKYRCYYLIYYEHFSDVDTAIAREKQIKGYRREKKEKLINDFNPNWRFLNDEV